MPADTAEIGARAGVDGRPARLRGLSLVLPAHNEVENVRWLLPRIGDVLPSLADRCEVILVDDGSDDGTAEEATAIARRLGLELRVIHHPRRMGYGITVADGLRAAAMEFTAFTDADGQLDVADLSLLIPLLDHAGMVGGIRAQRADHPLRTVVSGVFRVLLRILYGLRLQDVDCALKVMRTDFLRSIDIESRSAMLNAELYYKAKRGGWGIAQRAVSHRPRAAGRRKGASARAIVRAIKEMLAFRVRLWSRELRHRRRP